MGAAQSLVTSRSWEATCRWEHTSTLVGQQTWVGMGASVVAADLSNRRPQYMAHACPHANSAGENGPSGRGGVQRRGFRGARASSRYPYPLTGRIFSGEPYLSGSGEDWTPRAGRCSNNTKVKNPPEPDRRELGTSSSVCGGRRNIALWRCRTHRGHCLAFCRPLGSRGVRRDCRTSFQVAELEASAWRGGVLIAVCVPLQDTSVRDGSEGLPLGWGNGRAARYVHPDAAKALWREPWLDNGSLAGTLDSFAGESCLREGQEMCCAFSSSVWCSRTTLVCPWRARERTRSLLLPA